MTRKGKNALVFLMLAVICGLLGVLLGNISPQVWAVMSGSVCGVLAAIPTSLVIACRKG